MNKTYYEDNDEVIVIDENFNTKKMENIDNIEEKLELENDIEVLNNEIKRLDHLIGNPKEATILTIIGVAMILLAFIIGFSTFVSIFFATWCLMCGSVFGITGISTKKEINKLKLIKDVTNKNLYELEEQYKKVLENSKKKSTIPTNGKLVKNSINPVTLKNREELIRYFIRIKNKMIRDYENGTFNYECEKCFNPEEQDIIKYLLSHELEDKKNKVKLLHK